MRIGVCVSPGSIAEAASAGADFVEFTVAGIRSMGLAEREAVAAALKQNGIRCEAMNVLFPGDSIKITGGSADLGAIKEYAEETFELIHRLFSPSVVVFGSGDARRRPEGFGQKEAAGQVASAGKVIAKAAAKYGIVVALEPLNKNADNVVNTIAEAAAIANSVGEQNFKILADFFHMCVDGEPVGEVVKHGALITHAHIAAPDRSFPKEADAPILSTFVNALKEAGYKERVSIEASGYDPATLAGSIKTVRDLAG